VPKFSTLALSTINCCARSQSVFPHPETASPFGQAPSIVVRLAMERYSISIGRKRLELLSVAHISFPYGGCLVSIWCYQVPSVHSKRVVLAVLMRGTQTSSSASSWELNLRVTESWCAPFRGTNRGTTAIPFLYLPDS
jgi:hypothetical protein